MSKEEKEGADKEREQTCTRRRKLRSPCLDSHYEAYILRSRWTVGNLYASNLYLGQIHVKYEQNIDKQLKTWLHFHERDQMKLAQRIQELQALKRQSATMKSMKFVDKDFIDYDNMTSRHISLETAKRQTLNPYPEKATLRRQDHAQLRHNSEVFPPQFSLGGGKTRENIQQSRSKASNINPHPLRLLLPESKQTGPKERSSQRRTASGQVYHTVGSAAPINRDVLAKFSSLSSRWKSMRTSLSAKPRLTSVHEKGGKKLVPRWVPLAFRL